MEMAVFRYATQLEFDRGRCSGVLTPDRPGFRARPLYAIPHDPLLWGVDETISLVDWLRRVSKVESIILLRLSILISDPSIGIYVQEGSVPAWFKYDTKRQISAYKLEDYHRPEVLIYDPVPWDYIIVAEFPKELER